LAIFSLLLDENTFLAVVVTEAMIVSGDFVAARDVVDDVFVAHRDVLVGQVGEGGGTVKERECVYMSVAYG
jgi:hypothetical protein